ncbi:MAG: quinone-dependent dihydroorotate dehydrogenase [Bacteroidia bacterium]|nr:quinone-dependent dihydroorotate dehydrogenase [Bacteroidia bacterium]MDG2042253.1 quinone-dependent dihydroorotate dehydrogenase [Bacteroidia bacterium]
MYKIIRGFFFLMSAEKAHHTTMFIFKYLSKLSFVYNMFQFEDNPVKIDGITYKNSIGLAAGFDKDGKYLNELYTLNFGFVEIGTVTPKPQSGNPKPRLFRLKKDRALLNRMGFNNEGLKALKNRLKSFRKKERDCSMKIGVNIGKNKTTPNEKAVDDYVKCFEELYELADFFIVNVSSPNTPNLRELQNKDELLKILNALISIRSEREVWKPIYLKIAPDLTLTQLDEIITLQKVISFEGIVATNTSIDRTLLKKSNHKIVSELGNGGISGHILLDASNRIVRYIREKSDMTIIGVGGIEDEASAKSKLEAGANLLEIYTGFIYSGPGLIKKIGMLK